MYNESTWCWRCLQDLQPLYVWLVIANRVRRASNYCHHLKRIDGLLTRLRLGKRRHLLRATSTWVVQLLETNRGNWACIDTYRTLSKMLFSVILVRIPVNMTLYAPHVRNLLSEPGSLCCSTQRTLWRSIRLSEMMNALLRANQLKGIYMELASSWHTSVRGKMESPKQSSYVPRSVQDH